MKNYAKIEEGLITNVALFKDTTKVPLGWVDVTNTPGNIGDPIDQNGVPIRRPSEHHSIRADNKDWEITPDQASIKDAEDTERVRVSDITREQDNMGVSGMNVKDLNDFLDGQIILLSINDVDKDILKNIFRRIGIETLR